MKRLPDMYFNTRVELQLLLSQTWIAGTSFMAIFLTSMSNTCLTLNVLISWCCDSLRGAFSGGGVFGGVLNKSVVTL